MPIIHELFVTSIWGNLSTLERALTYANHLTRLHFLGNYFDNGPDPVAVFNRLVSAVDGGPDNVMLYRNFHEEALLRLTGHIEDTEVYRRFWISPYLGTPFTLSQFGIDPWPAYQSPGTQAPSIQSEVTQFIKKRMIDWSELPITSEQYRLLQTEMSIKQETRLLAVNSDKLHVVSTIPCDSHFFEQTLCPWVENQLNPFPMA